MIHYKVPTGKIQNQRFGQTACLSRDGPQTLIAARTRCDILVFAPLRQWHRGGASGHKLTGRVPWPIATTRCCHPQQQHRIKRPRGLVKVNCRSARCNHMHDNELFIMGHWAVDCRCTMSRLEFFATYLGDGIKGGTRFSRDQQQNPPLTKAGVFIRDIWLRTLLRLYLCCMIHIVFEHFCCKVCHAFEEELERMNEPHTATQNPNTSNENNFLLDSFAQAVIHDIYRGKP